MMALSSGKLALILGLFAVLCGCSEDTPPNQTVLRFFAADDLVVSEGATIRIEVWNGDKRQHEAGEMQGPFAFEDDTKLVVNARGGDTSRRFTVFAELLASSGERLSWARVRTGFLPGELSEVRVEFAVGCRPPPDRDEREGDFDPALACGSHDTCARWDGETICGASCVEPEPFSGELVREPSPRRDCNSADCQVVASAQTGWNNNCVVSSSGEVFCWGRVGNPNEVPYSVRPARILDRLGRPSVDPVSAPIDVTVHHKHVCVLDPDGSVRCGGESDEAVGLTVDDPHTPCCTHGIEGPEFFAIRSAGRWVGGITRDAGSVWYVGGQPFGAPGVPDRLEFARVDDQPAGGTEFFVGAYALASVVDGAFSWNQYSTVGPEVQRDQEQFLTLAQRTFCAINSESELRCWGWSLAATEYETMPKVFGGRWRAIALSKATPVPRAEAVRHRCGIRDDGTLWCWGLNEFGRLGPSAVLDVEVPEDAPMQVGTESTWDSVTVGLNHTCGLDESGQLSCFGDNSKHQLGSEFALGGPEPVLVCIPSW